MHATLNRRDFLRHSAAFGLLAAGGSSLALAATASTSPQRLVLVILRGGLDGLYAVPAVGDPNFAAQRGSLANYAEPTLPLNAMFALHPHLQHLHSLYQQGQMSVVHAVASPYRERSHFDAQQVLESGGSKAFVERTGWLNRALVQLGSSGMALTTAVPLALRGTAGVDTWAPSRLPSPNQDLVMRLEAMYQNDAALKTALMRAKNLHADASMLAAEGNAALGSKAGSAAGGDGFVALAQKAAEFLRPDNGPSVAVLELGGWDSHANQAAPQGALSRNLRTLDQGLAALQSGLQARWQNTLVIVASEFGRTVAVNGTQGTDHGTGGVAFVLGGKVQGGKVLGEWPGLSPAQLYQGRDLQPTTDLRAVFKGALAQQFGLRNAVLAQIFPDSQTVAPLQL